MKSLNNLFIKSVLLLLSITFIFTSCKKDDKTAPALPPESSFNIDFSPFANPNDTLGSREVTTYKNWGYAYSDVLVWQTFITVALAVPVAAFNESFNHEAVYHPNAENWTWSYNVVVNQVVYEAELTGYLQADSVAWEMRVTASSLFSDFLWFYGKSALDRSGGWWILQENPLAPNPVIRIEWNRYENGTADISYTDVRPGGAPTGSYIFYGTTTEYFDRFYHLYGSSNDNLTTIEWSSVNIDGRVKDAQYFGDDLWHCWDTNLMDIVCP